MMFNQSRRGRSAGSKMAHKLSTIFSCHVYMYVYMCVSVCRDIYLYIPLIMMMIMIIIITIMIITIIITITITINIYIYIYAQYNVYWEHQPPALTICKSGCWKYVPICFVPFRTSSGIPVFPRKWLATLCRAASGHSWNLQVQAKDPGPAASVKKKSPNRFTDRNHILVGGFNPSEKYEFVSWDDSSHMEK